jgi:hypothetical protein
MQPGGVWQPLANVISATQKSAHQHFDDWQRLLTDTAFRLNANTDDSDFCYEMLWQPEERRGSIRSLEGLLRPRIVCTLADQNDRRSLVTSSVHRLDSNIDDKSILSVPSSSDSSSSCALDDGERDERFVRAESLIRLDRFNDAKRLIWGTDDNVERRRVDAAAARQQRLGRAARGTFNQFFVATHRLAFDPLRIDRLNARPFLNALYDDGELLSLDDSTAENDDGIDAVVTVVAVPDASQSEALMRLSLETLLHAGEFGRVPMQVLVIDESGRWLKEGNPSWPHIEAVAARQRVDVRVFGQPAGHRRKGSAAAELARLINGVVAAEAKASRLLLWDMNALACTKLVRSMLDALDEHAGVGGGALAVGRVIELGSGRLASAANAFSERGRTLAIGAERYSARPLAAALSYVRQVDFSLAMCVMIDADTFAALGGLDDTTSPPGALIRLQLRATHERQLPVLYVPQASGFQMSDTRLPFSSVLSMSRAMANAWATRVTSAAQRGALPSRHTVTDRLRSVLAPRPRVHVLVALSRANTNERVLSSLLKDAGMAAVYRFTVFFAAEGDEPRRERADNNVRSLDRGPLQLAGIEVLSDGDTTSLDNLALSSGNFYDIVVSDFENERVAALAPLHLHPDDFFFSPMQSNLET